MESRRRSILKTLSWRFIAWVITATIVWSVTGQVEIGATVGFLDSIIKLVAYYTHERAWNRVHIGRPIPPDAKS